MTHFSTNRIDWVALVLIIVGAINWGLVGIGHFVSSSANWNLINLLLGSVPGVEFAVYLLVGLAGLYGIYFASRIAGLGLPEPEMGIGERGTPK